MPMYTVKVISLSRKVVETERETAKPIDRNRNFLMEIDESRASERVARARIHVES